jgi:hypothetical protein
MMRLNTVKFLMVGLVLFFSASSASAYNVFFNAPSATTIAIGETFTIQMRIDTEGATDTTSIFLSTFADPAVIDFVSGVSPGVALADFSTGEVLARASQPTLDPGDPPGFVRAASFVTATPTGTGVSNANQLLATLTFIGVDAGSTTIDAIYSASDTITASQVPVPSGSVGLGSSLVITVVPEPGTALLMGLGLAGLGLAGRRNA